MPITIIKKKKRKMRMTGKMLRHKSSTREKRKTIRKCMKNMILKMLMIIPSLMKNKHQSRSQSPWRNLRKNIKRTEDQMKEGKNCLRGVSRNQRKIWGFFLDWMEILMMDGDKEWDLKDFQQLHHMLKNKRRRKRKNKKNRNGVPKKRSANLKQNKNQKQS